MNVIIKGFPWITLKTIPGIKETHQFVLLPAIFIGRGFFTIFWFIGMLSVNFNTTLIKEEQE